MTGHFLRLTGRESIGSWFEQALIARRQDRHSCNAGTTLEADPPNWQRTAGLATNYNRHKFHAALIAREKGAACGATRLLPW